MTATNQRGATMSDEEERDDKPEPADEAEPEEEPDDGEPWAKLSSGDKEDL
jgi:hypothetical protein